MKKSELRQIIREELLKEAYSKEDKAILNKAIYKELKNKTSVYLVTGDPLMLKFATDFETAYYKLIKLGK